MFDGTELNPKWISTVIKKHKIKKKKVCEKKEPVEDPIKYKWFI
jgi:hypothetical protein